MVPTSNKLQNDGLKFIHNIIGKHKKYETHPIALRFLMRFYAWNAEQYRNGTMSNSLTSLNSDFIFNTF